jgi:hypothetical protein
MISFVMLGYEENASAVYPGHGDCGVEWQIGLVAVGIRRSIWCQARARMWIFRGVQPAAATDGFTAAERSTCELAHFGW